MNPEPTEHELTADDYIKLWTYFEDRTNAISREMNRAVIWVFGYLIALCAFAGRKLLNLGEEGTSSGVLSPLGAASCFGLALGLFVLWILREHVKEIREKKACAELCLDKISALKELVIEAEKNGPSSPLPLPMWNPFGVIIFVNILMFTLLLGVTLFL